MVTGWNLAVLNKKRKGGGGGALSWWYLISNTTNQRSSCQRMRRRLHQWVWKLKMWPASAKNSFKRYKRLLQFVIYRLNRKRLTLGTRCQLPFGTYSSLAALDMLEMTLSTPLQSLSESPYGPWRDRLFILLFIRSTSSLTVPVLLINHSLFTLSEDALYQPLSITLPFVTQPRHDDSH